MSDMNDFVQIARSQIGTEEDPKHQNVGSSIKKYLCLFLLAFGASAIALAWTDLLQPLLSASM